jgi:ATP/maltotriose-dependent transcriptional regulator MalT
VTDIGELCDDGRTVAGAGDLNLASKLLLDAALRCWWTVGCATERSAVLALADELAGSVGETVHVGALALAEPVLQANAVIDHLTHLRAATLSDVDGLRILGTAAHVVGIPEKALAYLDRADSVLRAEGRWGLLAPVCTMRAVDLMEMGDWCAAAVAADDGCRLAERSGQRVVHLRSRAAQALLAGLRGDNDAAQGLAAEVEWDARRRRLNEVLALVQLARGAGWLSAERYPEAYSELARMFDPADVSFYPSERFRGLAFLAEAAVHTNQIDDALRIVDDLELDAAVSPSTTLEVNLLYANAVLTSGDDAGARFKTAAASPSVRRRPWARARLEFAAGSWLRRQRRISESRDALRAAASTLKLIGATTWAQRARNELGAAGERPVNGDTTGPGLLSAQELEIAKLAALGLSNREIGERLFVSHRTVGSHLARIFPKLDITSRVSLGARLAELSDS